jgi:cytochrome P450
VNTSTSLLANLREITSLPGPKPWPLVGNIFQIKQARVHLDFEAWAKRYGKLFCVYFGRRPILVIADHSHLAAVLRDRPDVFRRPTISANVAQEMGGEVGVFQAEGLEWRNQRRMVMAGFAPGPIKAYFPSLMKVASRLQHRWQKAAQSGQAIDLSGDLKRYTVDIIAGLAFGTEVNTLESGDDVIQQYLDDILPAVARRSLAIFPYWRYFKLPVDRKLDRSVVALRVAITKLISDARQRLSDSAERREKPSTLLEAMLVAADTPGSGVDDLAVAGNVSTMLLAGEDTTANTIAWVLYLLFKNPQTLSKITEEVLEGVPNFAELGLSQIDGLSYLDACVQEAMRLKPVGPFMPLEAIQDTAVHNVRVPKGAVVWCIFRHDTLAEEYFPNATQFDPQRWLVSNDDVATVNKKISMPFGSGPRTCPGRYLALLEIKIALVMVLTKFKIEAVDTPDGGEAQELMAFVMSPMGLRLRLSPKNP